MAHLRIPDSHSSICCGYTFKYRQFKTHVLCSSLHSGMPLGVFDDCGTQMEQIETLFQGIGQLFASHIFVQWLFYCRIQNTDEGTGRAKCISVGCLSFCFWANNKLLGLQDLIKVQVVCIALWRECKA